MLLSGTKWQRNIEKLAVIINISSGQGEALVWYSEAPLKNKPHVTTCLKLDIVKEKYTWPESDHWNN